MVELEKTMKKIKVNVVKTKQVKNTLMWNVWWYQILKVCCTPKKIDAMLPKLGELQNLCRNTYCDKQYSVMLLHKLWFCQTDTHGVAFVQTFVEKPVLMCWSLHALQTLFCNDVKSSVTSFATSMYCLIL